MTGTTELFSYVYHRPDDAIGLVDWSANGKWIVCGTRKGSVLVLEAVSGKERVIYQVGNRQLWTLAWFPDNQHLLTCFEHTIMICHAWTDERKILYHHGVEGRGGLFSIGQRSPNGLLVASSAYEEDDPTIQVHEVETGHGIATFFPREPFDDLQAQHAEAELPVHHPPFYPIGWSPQGRYIAMGQGYKVHIWEPSTDQRVFLHSAASSTRAYSTERIENFAWSSDERYLVIAREEQLTDIAHKEHTIEVWDWAAGERWCAYRGHTNAVRFMQWLAGKDQIVSMSGNEMHLWDAHTGVCIARSVLPVEEQTVFSDVVLSPDRSQLALVGMRYLPGDAQEGLLCVWRHGLDLS